MCVSPPPPPSLGDVLDPKAQQFILIHGHSDLVRPVHDISVLVTPQPIRNFSCDVVGNQWQYNHQADIYYTSHFAIVHFLFCGCGGDDVLYTLSVYVISLSQ